LDLRGLYERNLKRFAANAGAARELLATGDSVMPPVRDPARAAALTMVARAVLNLHEVITRN
jgi:hypothetical protein